MKPAALLFSATLALPALMLLASLWPPMRRPLLGLVWLAPLPAVAASLVASGETVILDLPQARLTFALDAPGAVLLGVSAGLWIAAGFYANTYLRDSPYRTRFAARWLLTLIGNMGVFIAADFLSFYLLFAVVSLAAYGLVVFDGTARARRAASVYLALAILGEALLLLGFVLMAEAIPGSSLLIADGVAALAASPHGTAALILLFAGFGLKAGLAPLHVWLPLAHPAAPMPASAVLSGAIVNAGVIGLIRILPAPGFADCGIGLAAVGLFTAFYAVVIGITQHNPKTILAYSTASQMGVVAAVLGMTLATMDADGTLAASFYAAHHALAKAAAFLALGAIAVCPPRQARLVLILTAIAVLGLGGLPFSGGALAKAAAKEPLGDGMVGLLANISAVSTTLLMVWFLGRLAKETPQHAAHSPAPQNLLVPFAVTAAGAIIVPWVLYPVLIGSLADVLTPSTLWSALWPVLLGGSAGLVLLRGRVRLPSLPEGDIIVVGEAGMRYGAALGTSLVGLEARLQHWPVACLMLLLVAGAIGVAMIAAQ